LFHKRIILPNLTLNAALIFNEIQKLPSKEDEESRETDLKKLEKFINPNKLFKFWLGM